MKKHHSEKHEHHAHKGHHAVHPEHPSRHSHMNSEDPGLKREGKGSGMGLGYAAGEKKVKSGEQHHAAQSWSAAGNGYLEGDK